MADVLIVVDDASFNKLLEKGVSQQGHRARVAYNLEQGLQLAARGRSDVVYLGAKLPDGNGLDRVGEFRHMPGNPEVIIVTGLGEPKGAQSAALAGAWDFLEKPTSLEAMLLPMIRAIKSRDARGGFSERKPIDRSGIMGASQAIMAGLGQIARVAAGESPVLIMGETGTGKELFARAVHANSARGGSKLVVADCAASPQSLVPGLLFGRERGALAGTDEAAPGLISEADGGTLFLDNVDRLDLDTQQALLPVLRERRFRPVAATNRDLGAMCDEGGFRLDLFYHLSSHAIEVPPLRRRNGDITQLALNHLAGSALYGTTATKGLSPEFIEALTDYHWPGNVRELFDALDLAVSASGEEPVLYPGHLPAQMRANLARRSAGGDGAGDSPAVSAGQPSATGAVWADGNGLPTWRDFREKVLAKQGHAYLVQVLAVAGGDMKRAQEITGLSRARLYALLKDLNLPRRRWVRRNPKD